MAITSLESKSNGGFFSEPEKKDSDLHGEAWKVLRWAPLIGLFKFFSSVKLALIVLFSVMAALAAGTFLESAYGTDTARIVVYDSVWFQGILVVLGISVAAATVDRLPWKMKHAGFVITHLGILIILFGSFQTRSSMIDGQMAVAEGENEGFITLSEPILYFVSSETGKDALAVVNKKPFAWTGRENLSVKSGAVPFRTTLIANYPKARFSEKIIAAPDGNPAVQVTVHNSFMNQTLWLLEEDSEMGNIQMGPARFRFSKTLLTETQVPSANTQYLELQFEDQSRFVALEESLKTPATLPVPGTSFEVTVNRILKNAMIVGRELHDIPEDANLSGVEKIESNPAVEFILKGSGVEEKHVAFAKYPEFPTQHGLKPSASGARIFYRLPGEGAGSKGETHELRFVLKEGELYYQIQDGFKITTVKTETGKDIETGWMDLHFRVNEFLGSAGKVRDFTPAPENSTALDVAPAIGLELTPSAAGSQEKPLQVWMVQGAREKIRWEGKEWELIYGQRRIPAGFKIELKDFRVEQYPGTNRPASFESDVTLIDHMKGLRRDATISMNKPLVHRGFRVYQSGYEQPEGGPEISVFSVGLDPGIPAKYIGTIVMVSGILLMFYTRRFSSNAGRIA